MIRFRLEVLPKRERLKLEVEVSSFRVATYNVHACVGLDRRQDPSRVAAVIRELDADLIALQEVSTHGDAGDPTDQLKLLSEETKLFAIPGHTLVRGVGPYGNALLSRHAPLEVRKHDLSFPRCEPRGALDVDFEIEGVVVRIVATHLGLKGRERRHQIDALTRVLAGRRDPLILMGDFNEWLPRTRLFRTLGHAGPIVHPRSYPSWYPVFALDRIWSFPETLLDAGPQVHRSKLSRQASDHLPVVADIGTRAQSIAARVAAG